MDRDRLLERLVAAFAGELEDHVRVLNEDLLALEKERDPAERKALLDDLFRTAHSVKGSSRAASIAPIEAASSRMEELLSALREGRRELDAPTLDLFFEVTDALEEAAGRLRERQGFEGAPIEVVAERLEAAAGGRRPSVERPALPTGVAVEGRGATVRTSTERLDRLMNLTGELIVARDQGQRVVATLRDIEAHLSRWRADWRVLERVMGPVVDAVRDGGEGGGRSDVGRRFEVALGRQQDHFRRMQAELDRLRAEVLADRRQLTHAIDPLADEVRTLRLMPFVEATSGLDRTARDLARGLDKEVEVVVAGGDVEMDRAVVQALRVPLLQLVRNAVDHGVEGPEARQEAGKVPQGRVRVAARLSGPEVWITVEDDGRGLDHEAIRARAAALGWDVPDDEAALAQLIFRPGFSTARLITDISGRGVGLDVVRQAVEAMQGGLQVASRPGQGTRFDLTVPLTLLTLRALLVEVGGDVYALPASHLRRLVSARREALVSIQGREALRATGDDDAPTPVVSLAALLDVPAAARAGERAMPVVVVGHGSRRVGLAVDALLREDEILVKHLGPRLEKLRHFSGATLLPSGRLALILHVPSLVAAATTGPPRRAMAETWAEAASTGARRVLLVDDSVTTRALERSILEAAGYEVTVAVDGVDAWDKLEAQGADILVADVEMPRMDGFALTEAVRSSARFSDLPVVLVTARETDRDKARGLEVGANAYLVKSTFDQHNLLETVEQLVGAARRGPGGA